MLVAVHLGGSRHEHVLGKTDASQALVRALHASDSAFLAAWHDDHQIHIAVVRGQVPRVRAEKVDFLRLKFGFEPFVGFFEQAWRNCLHAAESYHAIPKIGKPVVETSGEASRV